MAEQRIIDLDAVVPESIVVKMGGEEYKLPGDIPVPDFLEIARIMDGVEDADSEGSNLERLYELVLDLFQREDPSIEELPIGPARLGSLVVMLYTGAADSESPKAKAPNRAARRGTKSTSRRKPTKSASSKS